MEWQSLSDERQRKVEAVQSFLDGIPMNRHTAPLMVRLDSTDHVFDLCRSMGTILRRHRLRYQPGRDVIRMDTKNDSIQAVFDDDVRVSGDDIIHDLASTVRGLGSDDPIETSRLAVQWAVETLKDVPHLIPGVRATELKTDPGILTLRFREDVPNDPIECWR